MARSRANPCILTSSECGKQAREAVEASARRLQPSPSSVTEQATSHRHWVRREDVSAVTQHIIQHLPVKPVQQARSFRAATADTFAVDGCVDQGNACCPPVSLAVTSVQGGPTGKVNISF